MTHRSGSRSSSCHDCSKKFLQRHTFSININFMKREAYLRSNTFVGWLKTYPRTRVVSGLKGNLVLSLYAGHGRQMPPRHGRYQFCLAYFCSIKPAHGASCPVLPGIALTGEAPRSHAARPQLPTPDDFPPGSPASNVHWLEPCSCVSTHSRE
jgi:hypothetical protein